MRLIEAATLIVILAHGVFSQSTPAVQGTSAAAARPDLQLPPESAGWANVLDGLLSAFGKADVVALSATRGKNSADLRTRLIRHPDFPNRARFIIVEWGNSLYQPILDRYIQGE